MYININESNELKAQEAKMNITKDEARKALLSACQLIQDEATLAKNKLIIEWAREYAEFEVGDILENSGRRIKVESITATSVVGSRYETMYKGPELTKKLKLRKDENRVSATAGNECCPITLVQKGSK